MDAQRPVILTGIEELASRSDLLDRSIVLAQPAISEGSRREEEAFWREFADCKGELLGGLLDLLVEARRRLPQVKLAGLPRLADFAKRGAAAAPGLGWSEQAFLVAYRENRSAGHASAIEGSLLARAVIGYLGDNRAWTGTSSELHASLTTHIGDGPARTRAWPKSPLGFSNALRRLAPNLRGVGINVEFCRDTSRQRTRLIFITPIDSERGLEASGASESSDTNSESSDAPWGSDDAERPQGGGASEDHRFDPDDADDVDAPRQHSQGELRLVAHSQRCECEGCPACNGRAGKPCGQGGLRNDERAIGLCRWCVAQRPDKEALK